ncbi:MAG: carboxypeptidase-like regulatory domain-containing protein, partial [Bacteroidota bacterium]
MKTQYQYFSKKGYIALLSLVLILIIPMKIKASIQQDVTEYNQYSGIVVDSQTGDPLVFATLTLDNTNISTVSNTEGEFLLKTPVDLKNAMLTISILGYKKKTISLSHLKEKNNIIKLESSVISLSEVIFNLP